MARPKRLAEERICPACGVVFEVGGRGRRPLKSQFCSRRCAYSDRVKLATIEAISATEAAYIAGLLDGEGSIVILKPRAVRQGLRVVIVNTHQGVIEWLRETVGGNVNVVKRRYTTFKVEPKPVWTWTLHGQNAVSLLTRMLPYMVIKKERAVYAISTQPPLQVTAMVTLS